MSTQMKKVDLDKAAWEWAKNVDPENISGDNIRTAYRIDAPKCEFGKCRRNCRGNPFCLSGLGEAKVFSELTIKSYEEDGMEPGFRVEGSFVGLRNLGATCYVNSLLQLLFHNITIRNAILNCDDPDIFERDMTLRYLQNMFALMQFGKGNSVDPSDLIKSLRIEPHVQQDAHEFLQLFIHFLEVKLKEQADSAIKNVLQNNFQGRYNYETRCSKCSKVSIRESTFYELQLNVKGHKTLHESFLEYLREEQLEGLNMYSCQSCEEKQVATRRIRLTHLPPVLNLQMNIYYFDRVKLEKKKLKTPIQFPERLELSRYMCVSGENDEQMHSYNLSAVLLHKGTSAYSGHYVANICDQTSGSWYMFNDEAVTKMEGKNLKLSSDDDYQEDGGKKLKKIRPAKGLLSSSNAYMLVYTRANGQGTVKPLTREELPSHLSAWLDEHNQLVDTMLAESRELKRNQEKESNLMKTGKIMFLKECPVKNDFDALSVSWLINFIACENYHEFYSVNNDNLVCEHGKLNPDSVTHYKYIDSSAAETIYTRYGGGPRLTKESLCAQCVELRCRQIKMTFSISNDQKELARELLFEPTDVGYWVGKDSLKTWKKKAASSLTLEVRKNKENVFEEDCDDEDKCREVDCDTEENSKDRDSSAERNHGHMFVKNSTCSRDMCELVMHREFVKYCKQNAEFINICSKLLETPGEGIPEEVNQSLLKSSSSLISQINFLVQIFTSSNSHCEENSQRPKKVKLKNPETSDDEGGNEEFNCDIVCQHGNLIFDESHRRLISEQAWKILRKYFSHCKEFDQSAEPCTQCQHLAVEGRAAKDLKKNKANYEKELLSYLYHSRGRSKMTDGKFYFIPVIEFLNPWRKFIKAPHQRDAPACLGTSSLLCQHGCLRYNPRLQEDSHRLYLVSKEEWHHLCSLYPAPVEIFVEKQNDDIVFTSIGVCEACVEERQRAELQELLSYKKAKVFIKKVGNDQTEFPLPSSASSLEQGNAGNVIRRSARKMRTGDTVVTVCSSQTLMDLKLQLLNLMEVAPFDQHLYLDGGPELCDHQATLAGLHILPNSVIYLKVDEAPACSVEDVLKKSEPEHGFKGTGLMS